MTRQTYTLTVLLLSHTHGLLAQSPGGVSANLTLWVKADSAYPLSPGQLTRWPDLEHNNTFSISGTAANITTVQNVINFHPVVRFSGNAKLVGATNILWSECSAVASWNAPLTSERGTVISPVHNGTAVNDASRYFFRAGVESSPGTFLYAGMGVDSIGFEYIKPPPNTKVSLLTASGTGDVFNQNGLDARAGSLFGGFTKRGVIMNDAPQIGDRSTGDSKMNGDIAEIIVYGADNAANRNRVESYLALKYGISLGSVALPVPYTSSTGNIFWSGTQGGYHHNVFGIGRDNGSGLVQSQSNSINTGNGTGIGVSSLGNLVLSAITTLADQQFLMIGTDSASLVEITIPAGLSPAAGSKRLTRTWKVQNTNSVGRVNLSFDKTGLSLLGGNNPAKYYLMIDNDGDGNFNTGMQSYYQASTIASNIISFNSVQLNNNVVFSIITLPVPMVVLPLVWKSFTADARQNTVTLKWTTMQETNAGHYEIEHSPGTGAFIKAGSIAALNGAGAATLGGADENDYAFQLDEVSAGVYYYRIRMIDLDGNSQYSETRSALIGGRTGLHIRSNPVRDNQLRLGIDMPQKNTALIRIVDRRGNIVRKKEYLFQQGANEASVDLSGLTGGMYFIQLQAGKEISSLPFLKY